MTMDKREIILNKPILDVCCGSKMFYLDKQNKNVLFCDKRRFSVQLFGKTLEVNPELQVDFRDLPFKNESFSLVIFDPPHIIRGSEKGIMCKKYGKLSKEWQQDIREAFKECYRVLKHNGTLIFKWSEGQIALSNVLNCFEIKPILCQKSSRTSHFCVFFKE